MTWRNFMSHHVVEARFFGELSPARKKPSGKPAHKTDGEGNVGQQQVRHVWKAEECAPCRATTYLADVRIVGFRNPTISAILLPQRMPPRSHNYLVL